MHSPDCVSAAKKFGLTASILIATISGASASAVVSPPPQNLPGWSLGSSDVGFLNDNFETTVPITSIGVQTVTQYNLSNIGNEGLQTITSSIGLGKDPAITISGAATATTTAQGNSIAQASGVITLTYYFILSGPSGQLVPLTIGAAGTTSGVNASGFGTSLEIHTPGSTVGNVQSPQTGSPNWTLNTTAGFLPNTVYTVEMTVEGEASATSIGGDKLNASFAASVDPTITIASNFSDASEYTLQFSPGITDVVPEPSTWAMMILGFCGLGFMAYRKKGALWLA